MIVAPLRKIRPYQESSSGIQSTKGRCRRNERDCVKTQEERGCAVNFSGTYKSSSTTYKRREEFSHGLERFRDMAPER
jgi:hypothetical protein